MVRNIMGALVEVGGGRRPAEEMEEVLASHDRTRLGPPAPPEGLWLTRVFYPEPDADLN
jgi:tRNA pseudouridine38-40 synthase